MVMPVPTSKSPEEREFVVDSGASMHMMSKKELSSEELDSLSRSRTLTVVLTGNTEVHTHEAAQVFVHDSNLFVTVRLLEETPASYRLVSFAKTTDTPKSGSAVKCHGWPKMGRVLSARRTVSYLLSFQGYPQILEAFRLLHRHHRTRWEERSKQLLETVRDLLQVHLQGQYKSEVKEWHPETGAIHQKPETQLKRGMAKQVGRPVGRSSWVVGGIQRKSGEHRIACIRTQFSGIRVETKSRKQNIYTHFPKDQNCKVCKRTKMTRAPCRRRTGEAVPRAEKFGDLITADHKVLNEGCESRDNHQYAVVVQDLATQWIQSYPCKTQTSHETARSLSKFLDPSHKPKVVYTDNSLECGAFENPSWNHRTSTPHRSETNGVRRVKEGTSAVLLQSGLDERWWVSLYGNAFAICETSKTSWRMGKLRMKGDLENHSKGQ